MSLLLYLQAAFVIGYLRKKHFGKTLFNYERWDQVIVVIVDLDYENTNIHMKILLLH